MTKRSEWRAVGLFLKNGQDAVGAGFWKAFFNDFERPAYGNVWGVGDGLQELFDVFGNEGVEVDVDFFASGNAFFVMLE